MDAIIKKVNEIDWKGLATQLHKHGYAIVPSFLSDRHCDSYAKRKELLVQISSLLSKAKYF